MIIKYLLIAQSVVISLSAITYAKPLAAGDVYLGADIISNKPCQVYISEVSKPPIFFYRSVSFQVTVGDLSSNFTMDAPTFRRTDGHFSLEYSVVGSDSLQAPDQAILNLVDSDFNVDEANGTAVLDFRFVAFKTRAFGDGWHPYATPHHVVTCNLVNTKVNATVNATEQR